MRFPIILIVALVASPHAFAQQTTILADNEAAATPSGSQATEISLEGFNGGVSSNDAHDGNGGGAMMIQMLMPSSGGSGAVAPGPFVSRPAVTGGAH